MNAVAAHSYFNGCDGLVTSCTSPECAFLVILCRVDNVSGLSRNGCMRYALAWMLIVTVRFAVPRSASKSRSLRLVPMVLTVATEATDGVGEAAPLRVAIEEPYRVGGALDPALTPGRAFGARVFAATPMRLCSRSERVVRWNATMGNCLWISFCFL